MLHHVSVGVTDFDRAAKFYDAVMGALGYKRVMAFPGAIAYGETGPQFWIGQPGDRGGASVGNGTHIALQAKSRRAVHAFHEAALETGGSDDGEPGPRPQYTPEYYGAFVRDPDGNKLEAMLMVTMERIAVGGGAKKKSKPAKAAKSAKAKGGRAKAAKAKAKPKAKAAKRGKAKRR